MIDVRELEPDDWRLWRCLRQSALAEVPESFGSALADWTGTADIEERWRARLEDVPVNLVVTFDGAPVGMVSVAAPATDGMVELISMWVAPEARGHGVGDEAVRQAIVWATRRFPNCRMRLSVKAGNRHAIGLYQRHGFVDAGPSPDDADERLMCRFAILYRIVTGTAGLQVNPNTDVVSGAPATFPPWVHSLCRSSRSQ